MARPIRRPSSSSRPGVPRTARRAVPPGTGGTAFQANERTSIGRKNVFHTIDLREMIRGGRRTKTISEMFSALVSPAARLRQKLQALDERKAAIDGQRKRAEQAAARLITKSAETKSRYMELRARYVVQRAALVLENAMDNARFRTRWRGRAMERQ